MFSHRRIIRSIQTALTAAFIWRASPICGFFFFVMGKISVGGNSRTRSMFTAIGVRAASRAYLNVCGSWSIINTPTGCLGVNLLLFF